MDVPVDFDGEEREEGAVMVFDAWDGNDSDGDGSSEASDFDDDVDDEDDDAFLMNDSADEEAEDFEILDPETTSSSSGSDNELDSSATRFPLLLNDASVLQHGILTSVRHHQCCDALAPVDYDVDKVISVHGKYAVLYDIPAKKVVASVMMGFEPYSIAQYGALFAAGGDSEIAMYQISQDSNGKVSFTSVAMLQVRKPLHLSAMNNGLRFGRCGSEATAALTFKDYDSRSQQPVTVQVRLLVANQDRHVYAFSIPPPFVQRSQQWGWSAAPQKSAANGSCCSCGEACQGLSATCCTHFKGPPSISSEKSVEPVDFLCHNLRAACPRGQAEGPSRPMMIRAGREWRADESYVTDAIGPFSEPVNCAAPSPNGCWIAVVGDGRDVEVVDFEQGYSNTSRVVFTFCNARSGKRRPSAGEHLQEGCQYAVWNSSSSLLAVSSDAHHMVRVWCIKRGPSGSPRMPTRQTPSGPAVTVHLVASVGGREQIQRPCLALQFDPLDENILYFVEKAGRLHAVDVRSLNDHVGRENVAKAPREKLVNALWRQCEQVVSVRGRLQESCAQSLVGCIAGHDSEAECSRASCTQYSTWRYSPERRWPTSGKITGLIASAEHGVLVACRDRTLQYQVLRKWSQESHHNFPALFKRTVTFLLLISNSCPKGGASLHSTGTLSSGFWSLPPEILQKVVAEAAVPVSAWSI